MELVLIDQNSAEWNYMWDWLASHPLNEGIEEPSIATNNGESWQYMGSYQHGGRLIHTLRHRNHPRYNRIETVSVSASSGFTSDQITKKFNL